jgi:hypothetical protein
MKLLIHKESKIVVRIISDDDLVDLHSDRTQIYGPQREIILDLMSSNAEVVTTTVVQPDDWAANAYKINQVEGQDDTWVANSDYVAPED